MEGKLPDEKVQKYYNQYWNVADEEAVKVGCLTNLLFNVFEKFIWKNGKLHD